MPKKHTLDSRVWSQRTWFWCGRDRNCEELGAWPQKACRACVAEKKQGTDRYEVEYRYDMWEKLFPIHQACKNSSVERQDIEIGTDDWWHRCRQTRDWCPAAKCYFRRVAMSQTGVQTLVRKRHLEEGLHLPAQPLLVTFLQKPAVQCFNSDVQIQCRLQSWTFKGFAEFAKILNPGDMKSVPLCLRDVGLFTRINEKRHPASHSPAPTIARQDKLTVSSESHGFHVLLKFRAPVQSLQEPRGHSTSSWHVRRFLPAGDQTTQSHVTQALNQRECSSCHKSLPPCICIKLSKDVNQVPRISASTLLQCLPFAIAMVLIAIGPPCTLQIAGPWTTANVTRSILSSFPREEESNQAWLLLSYIHYLGIVHHCHCCHQGGRSCATAGLR